MRVPLQPHASSRQHALCLQALVAVQKTGRRDGQSGLRLLTLRALARAARPDVPRRDSGRARLLRLLGARPAALRGLQLPG